MIIRPDKSYETHSNFPKTNWYENEMNNYVVDETTEDGKTLAEKIRTNYPYFDLVIQNNELIDVLPFNPISIISDKPQITTDGIDTATITATIDDINSSEIINFYVNGTLVSSENVVNGVETIQINATEPGDILVEAESTTKYGRNSITVKAVSV